jgi:hypothetical protein
MASAADLSTVECALPVGASALLLRHEWQERYPSCGIGNWSNRPAGKPLRARFV